MSKQVFNNLPISDLEKSTAFYEALGFTKNDEFSNDQASAMVWSENIYVMLLTPDFYKQFIPGKVIADPRSQSGVLLALSMESKESRAAIC